jgi:hypothetical protein
MKIGTQMKRIGQICTDKKKKICFNPFHLRAIFYLVRLVDNHKILFDE